VRHIICDHKIDGSEWLDTARLLHKAGLRSNATMLYGHIENDEDRVDHLLKLRALQDETGGFQTFIPLSFHPDNTALGHLPKSTGMTDIRQIAVGRLLLDNFPHIKSYWQMVTPKMAQIALRFGADDIDGTVVEEKIYHDAGASTEQGMRRQELERLITEAGRVPFERDTLYRAVRIVPLISMRWWRSMTCALRRRSGFLGKRCGTLRRRSALGWWSRRRTARWRGLQCCMSGAGPRMW
jgi:aminodeoxyfutalosine synthase